MSITGHINEGDYRQFVNKLNAAFGDVSPVLAEIGQIIVDSISENFDVGGRFGSQEYGGGPNKWIPSKRALRQGGMTLLDTGRLATSITYHIAGNAIIIGSNVRYAAIHNFGGQGGRGIGPIIPRPFAVIQVPEDTDDIRDALVSYYARRLASAFG